MTPTCFETYTDQWHGVLNIEKSGLVPYTVEGQEINDF